MSNKKIILVKLTPLAPFFFGGRKNSEAESETDYYLKSRYLPQQTAVLGMLRKELLIQNDLFPITGKNRGQAIQLIGESSFNADGKEMAFGAIQQISPLFLVKEETKDCPPHTCYYHFAPRDHGLMLSQSDGNYFFKDFKPKEHSYDRLLPHHDAHDNPNGEPITNIFIPYEQVGIKKGKGGQTEDEGYYKQIFYRLKKGFSFAFFLSLDTNIAGIREATHLIDNFVYLGGERSAFKMEIVPPQENREYKSVQDLFDSTLPAYAGHPTLDKIILTSDAFVDLDSLRAKPRLPIINGSTFFRNIRTDVNHTRKYDNLARSTSAPEKLDGVPYLGKQFHLLSRGSVLYSEPGEAETLCRKIARTKECPNYRKIGYNYYIHISSSGNK